VDFGVENLLITLKRSKIGTRLPGTVEDLWEVTNALLIGYVKRYSSSFTRVRAILDVICHMRSHSDTCHPTQVNAPRLTPARKAGTRLPTPEGREAELWLALL